MLIVSVSGSLALLVSQADSWLLRCLLLPTLSHLMAGSSVVCLVFRSAAWLLVDGGDGIGRPTYDPTLIRPTYDPTLIGWRQRRAAKVPVKMYVSGSGHEVM